MEIVFGLLIIAVGAFCQSSCYVPINRIKEWSWESYWIVQGVFAWLVFPFLGALLAVPEGHSLCELFTAENSVDIWMTILFGALWGVGGLTFGLSMRYLGVALGQSISLGTCAGLGTVLGPIMLHVFYPEAGHLAKLTWAVIIGVIVTLIGISIIGVAGNMKAATLSEEEKKAAVKDFNFPKGIAIALLAGFMSACFNVGLEFGSGLHFEETGDMFKTLPATLLVTLGGFFTNAVYCFYQNSKKPHMGRLWKDLALSQQFALLCLGRCLVVQSVLRPESRKRFPHRFSRVDDVCLLHTHGTQCCLLQCLGHYPQRVERLLAEDHRRSCRGYCRVDYFYLHTRIA